MSQGDEVLIGCLLVSPPEDPDLRDAIENLASFVAEGGPQAEFTARENNRDNPKYWYLITYYMCH